MPSHCRRLSGGRVAKLGKACSKSVQGASVRGTRISAFYSPKDLCRQSAARVQAYARGYAARRSARRSPTPRRSKRTPKKQVRFIEII